MDNLSRTIMTLSCLDCDIVPKVADAGRIVGREGEQVQVMHNGLHVVAGGYHGDWMAHIIRGLKGHHEPQEELIFHSLIRYARHGSLFVELGAFWAYYSLWYLKEIPGSEAVCIEPDPVHAETGRRNATLNGMLERSRFVEAWVGGEADPAVSMMCETTNEARTLPMVDMSSVVELASGRTIEFLHIDIQGAELAFLSSMKEAVGLGLVRFVMVSTHHRAISASATTHEDCVEAIRNMGGIVLCEHGIQESFSGDGLIAASFFPQDSSLKMPPISRNTAGNSLFPEP